jgi:hypothetical protein
MIIETSVGIYQQIEKKLLENSLSSDNIFSYSRDNANVNFAKHNLVFEKLKLLNPNIQCTDCLAHILHNCAKQADDKLQLDIESLVVKIFNPFSSAKHIEELKRVFDFLDEDYENLLWYAGAGCLNLYPAIERLPKCWPSVKSYFIS